MLHNDAGFSMDDFFSIFSTYILVKLESGGSWDIEQNGYAMIVPACLLSRYGSPSTGSIYQRKEDGRS